ncbi:PRC-barrel domain-containing protein [Methylocapsa acidiphila]|uniref:PRC-barrel domain-containing protein n=1 Tax=Methylocapsa acidiphila TaxID=133552 RepID=UPI0006888E5C|nr:PRC-barrel domain-containing protein [Methylocapsa acidiphila]
MKDPHEGSAKLVDGVAHRQSDRRRRREAAAELEAEAEPTLDRGVLRQIEIGASIMATTAQSAPQEIPEALPIGKIVGSEVYLPDAEKIGAIEGLLVDKRSGQVAFAVMSFGGFFGIGEEHFPIPWRKLHYKSEIDAYEIEIDEEKLASAPRFSHEAAYDWSQADGRQINEYYGVPDIF